MIETEQTVLINAPIERVWAYARDIEGWATLMPGLQDCAVIDENRSRWTLKVGVGGLVRTVTVNVNVEEWAGPENVLFAFALEGDPVSGGGRYRAVSQSATVTEVTLQVRVVGEGSMAAMWEAMGKPLLPQLAKGFALAFKDAIESREDAGLDQKSVPPKASPWERLVARLQACWARLSGPKSKDARL